jgi:hypothetical protein
MHALIGGIVDHHCSNFRSQPCHEERNISKKVPLNYLKANLVEIFLGWPFTKFIFFVVIENPR